MCAALPACVCVSACEQKKNCGIKSKYKCSTSLKCCRSVGGGGGVGSAAVAAAATAL